MSDIFLYLIQNFASHLLASLITLFILKYLLQYHNVPYSEEPTVSNRVRVPSRRSSSQNSLQRTNSKRFLKEHSSQSINRSSRSRIYPDRNEKPYILNQKGFLQPALKIEEHVYTTTLNNNGDDTSESDIYQVKPTIEAESYDDINQDNVDYLSNRLGETSNNTTPSTSNQKDPENLPEVSKGPSKNSLVSKNAVPDSPSLGVKETSSPGFGVFKNSSSLNPKTPEEFPQKSSNVFRKSTKNLNTIKEPPFQDSTEPKEFSKTFSPQDSEVFEPLPLSAAVKESSSLASPQGSNEFEKSSTTNSNLSKEPSEESEESSSETLKASIQRSKLSEELPLQDHKTNEESANKKFSDSQKLNEISEKHVKIKIDNAQSKQKCTKKFVVIDITELPERIEREISPLTRYGQKRPHYMSCESMDGDELLRCTRPKLLPSDSLSEYEPEEYSEDSSDTDMQNYEWPESPYCLRSQTSTRRYCDYQERPKRYDPDSHKTLIIDFRPGYFLSCFSKCCKKLFPSGSKNNCISNECKCNCSGCKLGTKGTKNEEKEKQKDTNMGNPEEKFAPNKEKPHNSSSETDVEKKEDSSKSEETLENDSLKSEETHNEKIVAFCNVEVNTNKGEMEDLFHEGSKDALWSDQVPSKEYKSQEDGNDILSSSTELIGKSYYQSRKRHKGSKGSFDYLKKEVHAFRECSNTSPLFLQQLKEQKNYGPKETSLIGWGKERSFDDSKFMKSAVGFDISDSSQEEHNSELFPRELPIKKSLNHKKTRIRKSSFSSNTSNDSELSKSKQENSMDPSNFCKMLKIDSEKKNLKYKITDSEERSSFEEELAKDLVQSFRTILSEMAFSTFHDTEFVHSSNSRKKIRTKMKPREKKQQSMQSSFNQASSNIKIDFGELSYTPSEIKKILISTSGEDEIYVEESDQEIKDSIQKNLEQLVSILPSISEPSPLKHNLVERRCGCKKCLRWIKKLSDHVENSGAYSYGESYSSKNRHKKRADTNTKNRKYASSAPPKKTTIERAIKKGLIKLSKLSHLEALSELSSHESIKNNIEQDQNREEYSSKTTKTSKKLLKKCTNMQDLTVPRRKLQSISSPIIYKENISCHSLTNDGSNDICHSNMNSDDEDFIPVLEENDGFMRCVKSADPKIDLQSYSKSNEFTESYSESPPDISQRSLAINDLSSYTILDLGFPYDSRFPKLSSISSDMDASCLVQPHGSKDIPEIDAGNAEVLVDGSRYYESRHVLNELSRHRNSKTRRINEEIDDGNISSDSDDGTKIISFNTYDNK